MTAGFNFGSNTDNSNNKLTPPTTPKGSHIMSMQFKKANYQTRMANARAVNSLLFDRIMGRTNIGDSIDCWPYQGNKNFDGYGQIKENGKTVRITRAIFSMFFPMISLEKPVVVRHVCHNPACINPAHLRPGTQLDNANDRKLAGRGGYLKGECNGRAKLSRNDVIAIRSSIKSGPELAKQFNVTRTTICNIRNRKLWSHME